jgi:hypothetical protein
VPAGQHRRRDRPTRGAPAPADRERRCSIADLAWVAGSRWHIEENFQAAKGLAGLDQHQVRRWSSWYRWTALAMVALAFLSIAAATEHACRPAPAGQVPLTRNEIAALIINPVRDTRHRLRWSAWRRRHQYRAKACHYQRQAGQP